MQKLHIRVSQSPKFLLWSIHPSVNFHWSRISSRWQQAKLVVPNVPVTSNTFQDLLGEHKAFPGHMRYIIPPSSSGSTPGSVPCWTCLEELQREANRWHPDPMPEPPTLAPFVKEQWLFSVLSLDAWAPHPTEETHLSHFSERLRSRSFGHFPNLMTRGQGWIVDRLLNRELWFWLSSLQTTMVQYNIRITPDAATYHLSISRSTFPSLLNKTPSYLNCFT